MENATWREHKRRNEGGLATIFKIRKLIGYIHSKSKFMASSL